MLSCLNTAKKPFFRTTSYTTSKLLETIEDFRLFVPKKSSFRKKCLHTHTCFLRKTSTKNRQSPQARQKVGQTDKDKTSEATRAHTSAGGRIHSGQETEKPQKMQRTQHHRAPALPLEQIRQNTNTPCNNTAPSPKNTPPNPRAPNPGSPSNSPRNPHGPTQNPHRAATAAPETARQKPTPPETNPPAPPPPPPSAPTHSNASTAKPPESSTAASPPYSSTQKKETPPPHPGKQYAHPPRNQNPTPEHTAPPAPPHVAHAKPASPHGSTAAAPAARQAPSHAAHATLLSPHQSYPQSTTPAPRRQDSTHPRHIIFFCHTCKQRFPRPPPRSSTAETPAPPPTPGRPHKIRGPSPLQKLPPLRRLRLGNLQRHLPATSSTTTKQDSHPIKRKPPRPAPAPPDDPASGAPAPGPSGGAPAPPASGAPSCF